MLFRFFLSLFIFVSANLHAENIACSAPTLEFSPFGVFAEIPNNWEECYKFQTEMMEPCACYQKFQKTKTIEGALLDSLDPQFEKIGNEIEKSVLVKNFRGQMLNMINRAMSLDSLHASGAVKDVDLFRAPNCSVKMIMGKIVEARNGKNCKREPKLLDASMKALVDDLGVKIEDDISANDSLNMFAERLQNTIHPLLENKVKEGSCIGAVGYTHLTTPPYYLSETDLGRIGRSGVIGGDEDVFELKYGKNSKGRIESNFEKVPFLELLAESDELTPLILEKLTPIRYKDGRTKDELFKATQMVYEFMNENKQQMYKDLDKKCESMFDVKKLETLFCGEPEKLVLKSYNNEVLPQIKSTLAKKGLPESIPYLSKQLNSRYCKPNSEDTNVLGDNKQGEQEKWLSPTGRSVSKIEDDFRHGAEGREEELKEFNKVFCPIFDKASQKDAEGNLSVVPETFAAELYAFFEKNIIANNTSIKNSPQDIVNSMKRYLEHPTSLVSTLQGHGKSETEIKAIVEFVRYAQRVIKQGDIAQLLGMYESIGNFAQARDNINYNFALSQDSAISKKGDGGLFLNWTTLADEEQVATGVRGKKVIEQNDKEGKVTTIEELKEVGVTYERRDSNEVSGGAYTNITNGNKIIGGPITEPPVQPTPPPEPPIQPTPSPGAETKVGERQDNEESNSNQDRKIASFNNEASQANSNIKASKKVESVSEKEEDNNVSSSSNRSSDGQWDNSIDQDIKDKISELEDSSNTNEKELKDRKGLKEYQKEKYIDGRARSELANEESSRRRNAINSGVSDFFNNGSSSNTGSRAIASSSSSTNEYFDNFSDDKDSKAENFSGKERGEDKKKKLEGGGNENGKAVVSGAKGGAGSKGGGLPSGVGAIASLKGKKGAKKNFRNIPYIYEYAISHKILKKVIRGGDEKVPHALVETLGLWGKHFITIERISKDKKKVRFYDFYPSGVDAKLLQDKKYRTKIIDKVKGFVKNGSIGILKRMAKKTKLVDERIYTNVQIETAILSNYSQLQEEIFFSEVQRVKEEIVKGQKNDEKKRTIASGSKK